MTKSDARSLASGGDSADTLSRIERIYEKMWHFCGGWNRRPFRERQIRYLVENFGVEIRLAPLGRLEAIATKGHGFNVVTLNRLLVPRELHSADPDTLVRWLGDVSGSHARFVLLHELAHIYVHSDAPSFWIKGTLPEYNELCWLAERSILSRLQNIPTTIEDVGREVEADFVALIAMVPDFVIWKLKMKLKMGARQSLRDAVVEYMGGHAFNTSLLDVEAHVTRLAGYRLILYERFAHLFREASEVPIHMANGHLYRNAVTIEETDAEGLRKSNGVTRSVAYSELFTSHPHALAAPSFCEAVVSGRYAPFAGWDSAGYLEQRDYFYSPHQCE